MGWKSPSLAGDGSNEWTNPIDNYTIGDTFSIRAHNDHNKVPEVQTFLTLTKDIVARSYEPFGLT